MSLVKKKEEEVKFNKKQLLLSKKFKDNKDALSAILQGDILYTMEEAETLLKTFMEGEK